MLIFVKVSNAKLINYNVIVVHEDGTSTLHQKMLKYFYDIDNE